MPSNKSRRNKRSKKPKSSSQSQPVMPITKSIPDSIINITAKTQLSAVFVAGAASGNWNFRGSSYDPNTGTFVVYGSTPSNTLRTLGQIYELVSFPMLRVQFTPSFLSGFSSSYRGCETAISYDAVATGGTSLVDFSQYRAHIQLSPVAIQISPSAIMKQLGQPHKLLTGNATVGVLDYAIIPSIMYYIDSPSPVLGSPIDIGTFEVWSVYSFERRCS